MEFNQLQKQVINTLKGAIIVSAPVGTGKTSILAERVVKALESGVKPQEVLCLTFTNRAAEEMSTRIKGRVGDKHTTDELTIKTFHGFCAFLVRAEAEAAGVSSDFAILDETEQMEILGTVLENYPDLITSDQSRKREMKSIQERIYQARLSELERRIGCGVPLVKLDNEFEEIDSLYRQALRDANSLDFGWLVLLALQVIYFNDKIREKWSGRYKFIQLDEFQDTHLSEYLLVKELAKQHGNAAFVGDLDQTIYGWRGSNPYLVAGLAKKHFAPVKEFYLEENYRFNKYLLEAMRSFLASFQEPQTRHMQTRNHDTGEEKCVEVFAGYKLHEEANWVADSIRELKEREPEARVAVLARANWLIGRMADQFQARGIAHTTLDKYDFFRRQEVKDILAYLKVLFNPFDLGSAYRVVNRPSRRIGAETLKKIREKGNLAGLKVSDFLRFKNYNFAEPFAGLLKDWQEGRLVVFDTETTGINPLKDEVIQIYGREVVAGKPGKEFHYYLKNTRPVGSSEAVHGLSDEYLQANGHDPKTVLEEFRDFVGRDAVVGHNVNFDISMVEENAKRRELDLAFADFYDTLDLARRLLDSESYRLGVLAERFGLHTATHDAADDVMATIGLLGHLAEELKTGQERRQELFSGYSAKFLQLATKINAWQKLVREQRPADALASIWQDSGLADHYSGSKEGEQRQESIQTLASYFREKDDPERPADAVLRELIQSVSLSKDLAMLALEKGKVPIVTVHQVKGLEFDYVFIVGANEYRFPLPKSDLEEEKRLFYVAMTRAKHKVYVSYSRFDDYERPLTKSRFLGYIDDRHIHESN